MRRSDRLDGRSARIGTTGAVLSLVVCALIGASSAAHATGTLGNYVTLKGGIYSPSASFNLGNVDLETTFDGDTETGVSGEVAIGRYLLPTMALELGVGYFKGKGSFRSVTGSTNRGNVDFNVIPFLLTAKAFMPAGQVDPYAELGIGSYFTKFDVSDNLNTFNGSTTFGMHAGAGLNVNISPTTFIGVETKYVWANPSFGNQKIKLNDTEYALNGFKLNGFTTALAFGLNF